MLLTSAQKGRNVAILAFGIAAIFISPTVKRTDALIYLENQKRKEATHNFKKQ